MRVPVAGSQELPVGSVPFKTFVTLKRDKAAALAFMKKVPKRHGKPEKIVTDGLRSYPAAMAELSSSNAER